MVVDLLAKAQAVIARCDALAERLGDPALLARPDDYRKVAREHAELKDVANEAARLEKLEAELREALSLRGDPEPGMREMAEAEVARLTPDVTASRRRLTDLLLENLALRQRLTVLQRSAKRPPEPRSPASPALQRHGSPER